MIFLRICYSEKLFVLVDLKNPNFFLDSKKPLVDSRAD